MKLYEMTDYNMGFGCTVLIDPEMICRVSKGGKIEVDRSPTGYGKPEDIETISEQSAWVYMGGLGTQNTVRLTWEAWEKLRAAAGIEVEVL